MTKYVIFDKNSFGYVKFEHDEPRFVNELKDSFLFKSKKAAENICKFINDKSNSLFQMFNCIVIDVEDEFLPKENN